VALFLVLPFFYFLFKLILFPLMFVRNYANVIFMPMCLKRFKVWAKKIPS